MPGRGCVNPDPEATQSNAVPLPAGTPYGAAYGPGDTIGFLIHLPLTQSTGILPRRSRTSKAFAYKGSVYFEENEIMDKSKVGGRWTLDIPAKHSPHSRCTPRP